ncbi:MAG: hypothetical protein AAFW73_13110 [Bacteroidota bacterium]
MNSNRLPRILGIFLFLLLTSQSIWAIEDESLNHVSSDDYQIIKIVDITQGPSLFVISGMSYLNKSAHCEVNIEVFQPGRLEYSLSSITGEILVRDHKRLDQGLNNVGISLADCPKGIYQLDLQLEREQKVLIIEKTAKNKIKASLVSYLE